MLTHIFAALLAAQSPQDCAKIDLPDERLACFDALFPGERAPIDPESQFGLSKSEQLRRVDRTPMPDAIEVSIKSVVVLADKRRSVQLGNGALWILPRETNRDRLRPGDVVSIQAAALGSFMLKTPNGILVRAKRAR